VSLDPVHLIAPNAVESPVGVGLMAARLEGAYRGETVATLDEDSKLTAAANKGLHTYFARQNKQTLATRAARKGRGTHLEAASRIADYYDKLPNMPDREALQRLVDKIRQYMDSLDEADEADDEADDEAGGPGAEGEGGSGDTKREGKEAIFAALQQFDPDVSHQWAALDIAREHFESGGAESELLELLDDTAKEFEKPELKQAIAAGFAAAQVAAANAATLETDPATVRDTYRSMLREQKHFGQLFDSLSKFDMLKSCETIIDTFQTAAGHDLASTGPSTDRHFLQDLFTELGKLKQIKSVLGMSSELIGQTERLLPDCDRGVLKPVDVTSKVLNFVAKPSPSLPDAEGLLGVIKTTTAAGKVVFVNGLLTMHGMVPDEVFPSFQARPLGKSVLISLSTRLVEAEERAFENSH
jgi:type III secretion system YopN/LcrE/InvE/MxiC family regulator